MPPKQPPVEPKVKKPRAKKAKPPHDFKIVKATPEAPIIVSFK
jgi:hypothetical protein